MRARLLVLCHLAAASSDATSDWMSVRTEQVAARYSASEDALSEDIGDARPGDAVLDVDSPLPPPQKQSGARRRELNVVFDEEWYAVWMNTTEFASFDMERLTITRVDVPQAYLSPNARGQATVLLMLLISGLMLVCMLQDHERDTEAWLTSMARKSVQDRIDEDRHRRNNMALIMDAKREASSKDAKKALREQQAIQFERHQRAQYNSVLAERKKEMGEEAKFLELELNDEIVRSTEAGDDR